MLLVVTLVLWACAYESFVLEATPPEVVPEASAPPAPPPRSPIPSSSPAPKTVLTEKSGTTGLKPAPTPSAGIGNGVETDATVDGSDGGDSAAGIDALLSRIESLAQRDIASSWSGVEKLRSEFRSAPLTVADALYAILPQTQGMQRLIAAELLAARKERAFHDRALLSLLTTAIEEEAEESVGLAAIRLLAKRSYSAHVIAGLEEIVRETSQPARMMEACLALYALTNQNHRLAPIFGLLKGSDDNLKNEAALLLASAGHPSPDVDRVLRILRGEPTERGREAARWVVVRSTPQPGNDAERELRREIDQLKQELSRVPPPGSPHSSHNGTTDRFYGAFRDVIEKILRHSVSEQASSERDLLVAALKAFVKGLDPYSRFLGPEEVVRREEQLFGLYRGFGLRLLLPERGEALVVAKVHKDGPAFQAGLRSGDRIVRLNGLSTRAHDLKQFDRLLRSGMEEISLVVERFGWERPKPFHCRRGELTLPYVTHQIVEPGIGYIKIVLFGEDTQREFVAALRALTGEGEDARRPLNSLVIDLRDNPGGLTGEAVATADVLVTAQLGLPLIRRLSVDGTEETVHPDRPPLFSGPIVVVVNRRTASAAELLAATLKDFQRAVVVGEQTYGKGLEQKIFPLSPATQKILGGRSQLILSTTSILRPLGERLQDGVTPDIEVGSPLSRLNNTQLQEFNRVMYSSQMNAFFHTHKHQLDDYSVDEMAWGPEQIREFDQLYARMATSLSRADVVSALRTVSRLRADEAAEGGPFVTLVGDPQLRVAVEEARRAESAR